MMLRARPLEIDWLPIEVGEFAFVEPRTDLARDGDQLSPPVK
jgi:hypothetical protein